ncbi:MAG: nucleotidyltransferase domain-containing protein [bacterium]|nr:nucleotidyltransferase domain-containing protein [bacterium]
MLSNFTKNQTLVLEIFFNEPDKFFYLRQIAQRLKKQPGVFQREINKLTEGGLLESYFEGNRRYFKLNKKYPLYKEIKSIFFKTLGIEGLLKDEMKKINGIKTAFIYGSFARGEEKGSSDVDIFIVGSAREDTIIDLCNKLERKINREINYVLMTDSEFKKKTAAKNSFLRNIMKLKKIKII